MTRSLTHLRRALFGLATACALAFGANAAFASPSNTPWYSTCTATGVDYATVRCSYGCGSTGGYCSAAGRCVCGFIP